MPYKLSHSSLSLLKDCPRCFWLRFNKKIKRPDCIFPSLPSGMDGILKTHFDNFMKKGTLPPELAIKGVKLFDDEDLLKTWRNNFKGIQWTDKKGNLFRGAIDHILKKGKKLIVLDFKTRGYPIKEETPEYYRNQLDIYTLLLNKNGYQTEDYAYLLFYYPQKVTEQGTVIFNTELVKMTVSLTNAEKIFKKAIKVLEGPKPKPSKECQYCQWKET